MVALAPARKGLAHEVIPTFKPAAMFSLAEDYAWGLAAADLAGPGGGGPDGRPEVAVAIGEVNLHAGTAWTGAPGVVWIYLNTGDWLDPANGLVPWQELEMPDCAPSDLVFGDVNGDGKQDLIVSAGSIDQPDPVGHGLVGAYVFLNSGNGTFALPPTRYATNLPVRGMAYADILGNDGIADIALAVDPFPPGDGALVYILKGQDDPLNPFLAPATIALNVPSYLGPSSDVVVAPNFYRTRALLNDLVTADPFYSEYGSNPNVCTLKNLDGNTLDPLPVQQTGTCSAPAWSLWDLVTARFTSFSLSDDVAGKNFGSSNLLVLHGNGSGNFFYDCSDAKTDTYDISFPGILPPLNGGLDCGFLNGGTKPDLVAADPSGDRVTILLGKGDGTFQFTRGNPLYHLDVRPPGTFKAGYLPSRVLIADLNQDGYGDIIASTHKMADTPGPEGPSRSSISVLINNGP